MIKNKYEIELSQKDPERYINKKIDIDGKIMKYKSVVS